MHRLIRTLAGISKTELPEFLRAQQPGFLEIRMDEFLQGGETEVEILDLLQVILANTPADVELIATLRPSRQGGKYSGDDQVRLGLLRACKEAGFHVVDLESDYEELTPLQKAMGLVPPEQFILSQHTGVVPSRELGMQHLQRLQDQSPIFEKLGFPAQSFAEQLRVLELIYQHAARNGKPAVQAIYASAEFRALAALAGNQATYGFAEGARPAVQGQARAKDIVETWEHWGLDEERLDKLAGPNGWYAVLGNPVSHSLSPRIHNAIFRAAKWQHGYGALLVPDSVASMRLIWSVASRLGLRGANITSPLKGYAYDACSWRSPEAELLKAVNTVEVVNHEVRGYNTDYIAAKHILERNPPVGTVLVLGGGATARTWLAALNATGVPAMISARKQAQANSLASEFGCVPIAWESRHNANVKSVVQTTPDPSAMNLTEKLNWGVEMVYATPSEWLDFVGGHTTNGLEFLKLQAAFSARIWNPDLKIATALGIMEAALA